MPAHSERNKKLAVAVLPKQTQSGAKIRCRKALLDTVLPATGNSAVVKDKSISTFLGSGGGTSGRAVAFCLGRLGSNPGKIKAFFSSELPSIYSYWVLGLF